MINLFNTTPAEWPTFLSQGTKLKYIIWIIEIFSVFLCIISLSNFALFCEATSQILIDLSRIDHSKEQSLKTCQHQNKENVMKSVTDYYHVRASIFISQLVGQR